MSLEASHLLQSKIWNKHFELDRVLAINYSIPSSVRSAPLAAWRSRREVPHARDVAQVLGPDGSPLRNRRATDFPHSAELNFNFGH